MPNASLRSGLISLAFSVALCAQVPPGGVPPGFTPMPMPRQQQPAPRPQTNAPNQAPPPAGAAAAPAPAPAGAPTVYGGLSLNNASLTEVIDLLMRQLKLNYVLDPRVKGGVILNTYGETKNIDTRQLLETILRINGFGMVQQGDLYRIVPLGEVSHLPIPFERVTDGSSIAQDDSSMLNLVFLKYVTAGELGKVMEPFLGQDAKVYEYPPANLLFILDSRRNMRRLMSLISLFDSDSMANQRVKLFEVTNSRPSDLVKELEGIVKTISLNDKNAPIKFVPVDRINTIIAIAPNPGAFGEVEKWIKKLDVPIKITAGSVDNYVYRIKYGQADIIGMAIMALYYGYPMGMMGGGGYGGGMGYGGGGFGGGYGGGGYGGGAYGGGAGYGGGGGYGGGMGYGGGYGSPYGGYGGGLAGGAPVSTPFSGQPATVPIFSNPANPGQTAAAGANQTGTYLSPTGAPITPGAPGPRIIPNPFDNTLLIQATPGEFESINKLLKSIDVPPRQVLVEAKIYSVDLNSGLATDVTGKLQHTTGNRSSHDLLGSFAQGATNLNFGTFVDASRELLFAVQAVESSGKAKQISAPSVIATDSIPASINIGEEVPTLTAQAATGVQAGGNSLFANSIANRDTGVTLSLTARVTPGGIVTMIIKQEVSAPTATTSSNIQSPSFSKRSVQTQVTVQDGDTIAIGGIIDETTTFSTSGIPGLNRIPVLGAAFGTRSYSKQRTELIIFLTPRVLYDTNAVAEATAELSSRMKHLSRFMRD